MWRRSGTMILSEMVDQQGHIETASFFFPRALHIISFVSLSVFFFWDKEFALFGLCSRATYSRPPKTQNKSQRKGNQPVTR